VKLHDLRPADGSRVARTRVGRGIAAGKGKTAGRGTKGQKARAGGSIPPWFEGGQTPLHMRIPKLRGFKNRGKIDYEIVNVGDIDARVEAGAFAKAGATPKKGEQLTINADVLRGVGLVRNIKKPLKVLGGGELSTALFVVADAFTKSATEKIEKAGGAVSVLEVPAETRPALGSDGEPVVRQARVARTADGRAAADRKVDARARRDADAAEAEAAKTPKTGKSPKASAKAQADAPTDGEPEAEASAEAPAKAKPARKTKAAETADTADTAAADEPADAPDAVADASDAEPVTGDDTESDSAAPGDDA
jgi:large subunit ribosomal protein L15